MIALNADDDDDPAAGLGGAMISLESVDIDTLDTEVPVDASDLMIAPSRSIDIAPDTTNDPVATSCQIAKPVTRHRKTPLRTRRTKKKDTKPSPPLRPPSKVDAEVRAYAQKAGVQPVQHVLF